MNSLCMSYLILMHYGSCRKYGNHTTIRKHQTHKFDTSYKSYEITMNYKMSFKILKMGIAVMVLTTLASLTLATHTTIHHLMPRSLLPSTMRSATTRSSSCITPPPARDFAWAHKQPGSAVLLAARKSVSAPDAQEPTTAAPETDPPETVSTSKELG